MNEALREYIQRRQQAKVVDLFGGTRRGVQLALGEPSLSMHEEIDYLKFGLAVGREGAENEAGQPGGTPDQAEPDNVEPLVLSP